MGIAVADNANSQVELNDACEIELKNIIKKAVFIFNPLVILKIEKSVLFKYARLEKFELLKKSSFRNKVNEARL